MTALTLATKACSSCGVVKPLSEFHRARASKDGHCWRCKPCARAATLDSQERRRAEMGDEAWLSYQREKTRRLREDRLQRSRDRANSDAYNAALHALRRLHQSEFDALLARERYERGLTTGTDR